MLRRVVASFALVGLALASVPSGAAACSPLVGPVSLCDHSEWGGPGGGIVVDEDGTGGAVVSVGVYRLSATDVTVARVGTWTDEGAPVGASYASAGAACFDRWKDGSCDAKQAAAYAKAAGADGSLAAWCFTFDDPEHPCEVATASADAAAAGNAVVLVVVRGADGETWACSGEDADGNPSGCVDLA